MHKATVRAKTFLSTPGGARENVPLFPGRGAWPYLVGAILLAVSYLSFPKAFAQQGVAAAGDPEVGRKLFTGAQRLQNGAPACRTCHSFSGIGVLGGGTMGRQQRKWDLTQSYKKLGPAVVQWPQIQVPMKAIFTKKPLTEKEKADLLAFLQTGQGRAPEKIVTLTMFSTAGALFFVVLAHLIWIRRLKDVRRTMVEESYKEV